MFDIGFGQLLIIAVIALIVLGPERLPKVARFTGLWVRRARAQWYSVKSELERELAAEELKRSLDEARSAAREIDGSARKAREGVQREFDSIRDAVHGDAGADAEPAPGDEDDHPPQAHAGDAAKDDDGQRR